MKQDKKTKEDKITDKLYKAVAEYIEFKGGRALIIGGTAIMQGNSKFNYNFIVRFTGKKPTTQRSLNNKEE